MEIKEKNKDLIEDSGKFQDDENKIFAKQEVKKISKLLSQEMASSAESTVNQDLENFENEKISDEEVGNRIMTALDSEVYKRRLTEKIGAEKAKNFLGELGLNFKEKNIHELNKLIKTLESEEMTNPRERNVVAERAKSELKEHITSNEYLQKLTQEFEGDTSLAKEEQEKRLKLVSEVPVDVNVSRDDFKQKVREILSDMPEFSDLSSEERERVLSSILSERVKGLYGNYKKEKGIAVFDDVTKREEFEGVVEHEIIHSSTEGEKGIPKKTRELLGESFVKSYDPEDEGLDNYLRSSHERLARKQLLDLQLEEYGIKKYGEKFTEKHYEAMMLLFKLKAFSSDVDQFIRTTSPDSEVYKQIFNEIAAVEAGDLEEITA